MSNKLVAFIQHTCRSDERAKVKQCCNVCAGEKDKLCVVHVPGPVVRAGVQNIQYQLLAGLSSM